jgi:hypothetical protein
VAVVVMNRTEQAIAFALRLNAKTAATELPPHSIATYLTNGNDCAVKPLGL